MEHKPICIQKEDHFLFFSYEDIKAHHNGPFPAGVALTYQLFQYLELLEKQNHSFISTKDAYFYSGIGKNGQGIIDTATYLLELKEDYLYLDFAYAEPFQVPVGPGGGKYLFEVGYEEVVWRFVVKEGLIPGTFFTLSKQAHEILKQRDLTSKEIDQLMKERSSLEDTLLSLDPSEIFLVQKINQSFLSLHKK